MAYPKDVFIASSGGTSVTVNYAAIENDFMFLIHQKKYGSVSGTPSGWTALTYNSVGGSGFSNNIWYRRATGSEPTSVTITSTGSDQDGQLIVCRGVHVTTAFDVTVTSRSSASANKVTSTAITPVTANSLILNICINNNAQIVPTPGPIKIARNNILSYYTYGAGASVAVPAHDYFSTRDSNINPALVTIALRDNGSDEKIGFVDISSPPAEVVHLLGINGETGHLTGTAPLNLTATITTLQGIATSFKSNSGQEEFEDGITPAGYETDFTSQACSLNGSSTNVTYDLENEIISLSGSGDSVLYDSYDALSKHIVLGDGTNFRAWRIDALNTVPTGKDNTLIHVIEVDGGFESEEFGTVTSTTLQTIDNFAYGCRGNVSYASQSWGFLYKLSTMIILGGSSSFPVSMNIGVDCAKTSSLRTVSSQNQQSQTQFFCAQKVRVGNGVTATTWDSKQHSLEWPSISSEADRRVQILVSAGLLGFSIDASANCNIDFSTTTFNMGNLHVWELVSGTSTSATYSEAGALVISGEVILRDIGRAIAGMTFTACNEINKNDADLSGGNTIDGCVETNAITVTSEALFDELANCTFSNNNRAILITGNQTGSWSDPNFTMSGNTFDIEYTGTTNFSIQSANAITVNNASSGVLTVVTPVESFTINSSESGSLIQIFTTATQTVLASTTGTTLNHVFSGTVVVDYVIQKAGFLPQRFVGVTLTDSSVSIVLGSDPIYESGHGLTYTTDLSYNRTTSLLTLVTRQSGRDFYSALIDAFIAQTTLRNTEFKFQAVGPDSIFFINDAEIIDATSEDNWNEAGIRYLDNTDVVTAEWVSVKSSGIVPGGALGEYQQTSGGTTTDLRATGVVDQIIQVFGDVTHGNFDFRSHLVVKFQVNGYREVRADVLALAGIASLEPFEYSIAMEPVAIAAATGDPTISITITDHGASPVTWNTLPFSITIVDNGTNSGEDILRELNYNLSLDATYEGKDPFNWPEMVKELGSSHDTLRGITEGGAGATLKGVRVLRGGVEHPDFTRFQSDTGVFFTPTVTNQAQTSGLRANSRIQVYNVTTATEIENSIEASDWSLSYTEGVEFTQGDSVRIRCMFQTGTDYEEPFETTVIAGASGFTALINQEDWTDVEGWAIDGSTLTGKFAADGTNIDIDITGTGTGTKKEVVAWWGYYLTTADGIENFWDAYTVEAANSIRQNVNIIDVVLEKTSAGNFQFTDNDVRYYRSDLSSPYDTTGNSIFMDYSGVPLIVETGVSGLTASESTQLLNTSTFNPQVDTVEGSETYQESLRLIRAEAAGKLAVSGSTVTFRDAADTKDRITATVDANGQRTSITTDVT
ncbi:MAG: hypothetical protein JKY81_02350 [Colwellia sp.]|nr:hypothetical protein [Colwellia sp.]